MRRFISSGWNVKWGVSWEKTTLSALYGILINLNRLHKMLQCFISKIWETLVNLSHIYEFYKMVGNKMLIWKKKVKKKNRQNQTDKQDVCFQGFLLFFPKPQNLTLNLNRGQPGKLKKVFNRASKTFRSNENDKIENQFLNVVRFSVNRWNKIKTKNKKTQKR